jgi:hypothetical protein
LCGHEASVSKCKPIDCNYNAIKCLITDDFTSPTDSETGSKTPTTQQPWKCCWNKASIAGIALGVACCVAGGAASAAAVLLTEGLGVSIPEDSVNVVYREYSPEDSVNVVTVQQVGGWLHCLNSHTKCGAATWPHKTSHTECSNKCFICDHDFSKLLNPKALAGLVTAKKINVPKMCKVFRESEMSTHVIVHDEESKTIAYFSPRSDWPTTGVVALRRQASGMRKFVSDMKIAVVVGAVCAVILLPVLIVVGILKGVFEFLVPPKSLCDSSNPYAPDW